MFGQQIRLDSVRILEALGVNHALVEIDDSGSLPFVLAARLEAAARKAGLTSREIVEVVRGLRGLPLVAFDVVEVSPPYDSSEITALLAANLVYELLMVLAERQPA